MLFSKLTLLFRPNFFSYALLHASSRHLDSGVYLGRLWPIVRVHVSVQHDYLYVYVVIVLLDKCLSSNKYLAQCPLSLGRSGRTEYFSRLSPSKVTIPGSIPTVEAFFIASWSDIVIV